MKKLLLTLALVLLPTIAHAQVCPRCGRVHAPTTQYQVRSTSRAQAKANAMASRDHMSHAGPLAGQYEGVGFSSSSAQSAIRACCYWGRRTPIDIGVARGRRGWYACVGYR